MGTCWVSTTSQSYPLCANCSATVGLCEFKNCPNLSCPARNCFLNSAPLSTSLIRFSLLMPDLARLAGFWPGIKVYNTGCAISFRLRPSIHKEGCFVFAAQHDVKPVDGKAFGIGRFAHRKEPLLRLRIAHTVEHGIVQILGRLGEENSGDQPSREADGEHHQVGMRAAYYAVGFPGPPRQNGPEAESSFAVRTGP